MLYIYLIFLSSDYITLSKRKKGPCWLCSLLQPHHIQQYLAHSRYSLNIYSINGQMNSLGRRKNSLNLTLDCFPKCTVKKIQSYH